MSENKFQNPIQRFGETTMKIGKFKDKTFDEICKEKDGKRYLYWFVENVINEQNEKFYLKLMSYVKALRALDPEADSMAKRTREIST